MSPIARKLILAAIAFLTIALLTSCRVVRTQLPHEVVLPLKKEGASPVVRVEVDGRKQWFLVDTGNSETIVYQPLPDAKDPLPTHRFLLPSIFLEWGVRLVTRYVHIERLAMGEATAGPVDAALWNWRPDKGQDGILGMDILGQWATLFDVDRGEVRFFPASIALDARLAEIYPGRRWHTYPLSWRIGRPFVTLPTQDGGHLSFLIDTGATCNALTYWTAWRRSFSPIGDEKGREFTAEAFGNLGAVSLHRLDGLLLGDCEVSTLGFLNGFVNMLGFEVLNTTPLVMDGPGKKLWIASLPEGSASLAEVWLKRLEQGTPLARGCAVNALMMAPTLHPRVLTLLDSPDASVRTAAWKVLSSSVDVSWDPGPVAASLDSRDPFLRAKAVYTLKWRQAPTYAARFTSLLEDPAPGVRTAALCALESLKDPARASRVAARLEDTDRTVRAWAALTLWNTAAILKGMPCPSWPRISLIWKAETDTWEIRGDDAALVKGVRAWWVEHKGDPIFATK